MKNVLRILVLGCLFSGGANGQTSKIKGGINHDFGGVNKPILGGVNRAFGGVNHDFGGVN